MNLPSSAMILVLPLLTEESATSASTNSASSTGAVEESAEDEDEDDVEVPIPPKPARDADGKFVAKAKVSGGDARTHTNPMRASGASRRTTDVFMPARMIDRLEAAVAGLPSSSEL